MNLFVLILLSALVKHSFCSNALKDAEILGDDPIPRMPLGDTNYIIFRKRMQVFEAEIECAITIGRLAVFLDRDMAKKVIQLIANLSVPFSKEYDDAVKQHEFGMDRRYWIGLSDLGQEGDWTWMSDGTKLGYQTLWYEDQPDHLRTGRLEHCVALWNPIYYEGEHHSFNDESCEHKHYFICEDITK